jgi:uncharacterized protein YndB with AHSA1/START domain
VAKYKFVDPWVIQAPIEEVYRHIADPRTFAQWWPVYSKVAILEEAPEPGVGGKALLTVKSALGYSLELEVETVEADPPRYLKTVSRGQLEGAGEWQLEQTGNATYVTFSWVVESHHPLLNWLEPIAKPLFTWSHNDASRKGHQGLKKLLEEKTMSKT